MPDSNLRINIEAQLAALREYVELLKRAEDGIRSYNEAAGTGGGGGPPAPGGGGGVTPSPSGPSAPVAPSQEGEGTPGPSAPVAPSQAGGGGGGATLQAGVGAAMSGSMGSAGALIGGLVGGGLGSMIGAEAGGLLDSIRGRPGSLQRVVTSTFMGPPGAAPMAVGRFALNMANKAATFGLGQSPLSFILSSGDAFMRISTELTRVGRAFREAADGATTFGNSMGYTLEQSAALAATLGGQTNAIDRGVGQRYLGVARDRGMNAGAAMGAFGSIQRLNFGHALTQRQLTGLLGRASQLSMGQGRLPEYLEAISSYMDQQLERTGHSNVMGAGNLSLLAPMMFGGNPDDPLVQGRRGARFVGQLSAGFDKSQVRATMLRALGYGQRSDLSYTQAIKQIEAGATDPSNLATLYRYLSEGGYGPEAMKVVMAQTFGIRMWEASSMVDAMGTPGVLGMMEGTLSQGDAGYDAARKRFMEGLDPGRRAAFERGGFAALGRESISSGEGYAVRRESLQMEFGPVVAQIKNDMLTASTSIAHSIRNLIQMDLGEALIDASRRIVEFADTMEEVTKGIRDRGGLFDVLREETRERIPGAIAPRLPPPRGNDLQPMDMDSYWRSGPNRPLRD